MGCFGDMFDYENNCNCTDQEELNNIQLNFIYDEEDDFTDSCVDDHDEMDDLGDDDDFDDFDDEVDEDDDFDDEEDDSGYPAKDITEQTGEIRFNIYGGSGRYRPFFFGLVSGPFYQKDQFDSLCAKCLPQGGPRYCAIG